MAAIHSSVNIAYGATQAAADSIPKIMKKSSKS